MFWGAESDQLRAHADAVGAAGGRCAHLLDEITTVVDATPWVGPDAEAFRHTMRGAVSVQWHGVVDRLHASSRELLRHAEEQDVASEGSGGPTAGLEPVRASAYPDRSAVPSSGVGSGESAAAAVRTSFFGRDGDDEETAPVNPDGTIDGPAPFGGHGLGPGVPGTTADAPAPPAWEPADEGSGEWGVREPTDEDHETVDLVEMLILGGRLTGKGAASDNLQHYIDNTGEDKPIDVDDMMDSVPDFDNAVSERQQSIGMEAIAQAQESGATGPVTFPVNTDWAGESASQSVSEKYFYATGSFDYNLNGTVTAYPPETTGGDWTYEVETTVNVRDRYNWDTGKGVSIDVPGPDWLPGHPGTINIPDTQMQGLHQSGMAREYNIVGESDPVITTGP